MHDPQAIEQRLVELEIKAAFTEDLLDSLNETIVRQQGDIDLLMRELREVRAMRDQASQDQPNTFRSLRDELPPHY